MWRIILKKLFPHWIGKNMRREALFSNSGFYGFLLNSNVLLHREATKDCIEALGPILPVCDKSRPVTVLDLACGGWPLAIANVMAAYPDSSFNYTGVDINPDQVSLASTKFPFPENVTVKRLLEGNAWELDSLNLNQTYALIFSGMNIHHGTPEEVAFLGIQVQQRLQPGGRFISHDVYRPDNKPYIPRPSMIDGKSASLVNSHRLPRACLLDLSTDRQVDKPEPAWRLDYLERMRHTLLERGADQDGAESTVRHMLSRDYPISTREMRHLMEGLGFQVQIKRYDMIAEPLSPYVATCIMTWQ